MHRKIVLLTMPIAMAAVLLCVDGCTLIGLGIGAIVDSGAKTNYAGWKIARIKPGKEVTLYLKDGSMLFGKYDGLIQTPDSVYHPEYSRARESLGAAESLPHLNDTLILFLKDGREVRGLFAGFDYRIDTSGLAPSISIRNSDWPVPRTASIDNLAAIKKEQGESIDMQFLVEAMDKGNIPVLTAVSLQVEPEKKDISLEKIMMVSAQGSNKGKATGAIIGLLIDATIVIAVAIAAGNDEPSPPSPPPGDVYWGSCPFVYSFDGEKYILDSEPFGGAIFKAAQRTDLDNLDHLAALNGVCRLKLANELEEMQYVDQLQLMVIDHPAGVTVIPSFTGRLHTFSNPVPPARAIDYAGSDVIGLIDRTDSDLWISNPFGRNPENISAVRDGLYLDFPRPAESDFVKLALNLQNTNWAAYMQAEMLKLQGTDLDAWYDLLNSSAKARGDLQTVMVREGMLLIHIWNGRGWQSADFVWEVGPALPKDQAVLLDIRDIPGDTLKIRLESTAGFWMINSVVADFSLDLPCTVAELSLKRAIDFEGRDRLGSLRANDGGYYIMASKRDWADLEFEIPPPTDGCARSFILKCSGYYTINVIADGEPQKKLVSHLMKDPGAYGQFALRKLFRDIRPIWTLTGQVPARQSN